jgi:hypothetical protein
MDRRETLERSQDMEPVAGEVELEVDPAMVWEVFSRPHGWPAWNPCFAWVRNRRLELDAKLVWAFEPVRAAYLYRMPAIATIVELEPGRRVTWEVTAFPGMYARHTYWVEPREGGGSRFGSWEQAMGPGFRALRRPWLAHFRFVRDASLDGARTLDERWRRDGTLDGLLAEIDA